MLFKDIKKEFKIFNRKIFDKNLHYLDNAATTQIPDKVLNAIIEFETKHRANVKRGNHTLSEEATNLYEESRKIVADFIGASVSDEVIFTNGATDSLNLVAIAWGEKNINEGDVILVTEVEHHSNFVPWLELAKRKNAKLEIIKVSDEGKLLIDDLNIDFSKLKLVSFAHVSNVLGVVNDVKNIVKNIKNKCSKFNVTPRFVLDGAQSVSHFKVNVKSLGVDFLVFSGHKMCGPFGIGGLYINRNIFNEIGEYKYGGGMIKEVSLTNATYGKIPHKLEAGTPNISGAIGLAEACKFLSDIGLENIYNHEKKLAKYLLDELQKLNDVIIYGPKTYENKIGLVSFNVMGIPSHDLASILDVNGVAIRSGQHCVMPWHTRQTISTTARASVYLYNDEKDVDALISGIKNAKDIFIV